MSNGQSVSQRPQFCALIAFCPVYAQQISGGGGPGNKIGTISPSNRGAGACRTKMYNLDVYISCIFLIQSLCFTSTFLLKQFLALNLVRNEKATCIYVTVVLFRDNLKVISFH